jgi:hypothetical protein
MNIASVLNPARTRNLDPAHPEIKVLEIKKGEARGLA